ncbi:hypothetical protein L1887_06681 [Cichorium endivia]|nr:hypothetical protein L1887_06681 [Cichorium endivia]
MFLPLSPHLHPCKAALGSVLPIKDIADWIHDVGARIVVDACQSVPHMMFDVQNIEGEFVQGMGWMALEELKWGNDAHKWIQPGFLFTFGPGNYKIPFVNDVPF